MEKNEVIQLIEMANHEALNAVDELIQHQSDKQATDVIELNQSLLAAYATVSLLRDAIQDFITTMTAVHET